MKPEPAPRRLPPGQRLAKGWPVLNYGSVPPFDPATWDFRVWGEVGKPLRLTYAELRGLPAVHAVADFHCVTKFSVLDNRWEGVRFRTIAELAGVKPTARAVMAHCEHGYEANLPLEVMLEEDVLLSWARNGEPLTPEHGYPLRLVVPSRYAWKSAKWVRGLELMAKDRPGFWEERGYHNNADPWNEERYSYQEGFARARFWRRGRD
ncbi:MAG: sulfite oxidase-like oxidoreductase [Actinomycetota bacterium]